MAKRTPRPGRTLLIFLHLDRRALRAGRARRHLEAAAGPRPRGRHPDHARRRYEQSGQRSPRRSSSRPRSIVDRRVNGSGVSEAEVVHAGQPQHHRRDPRQERLEPRRLGQAHRAAALPASSPGLRSPGTPAASPSRLAERSSPCGSARGTVASPKASPKATPTPKAGKASATPNPRPAPFAQSTSEPPARRRASRPPARPRRPRLPPHPRPSPTRGTRASRRPPQKGASINDPVAWAQNPGAEWLGKFATYTCPTPRSRRRHRSRTTPASH